MNMDSKIQQAIDACTDRNKAPDWLICSICCNTYCSCMVSLYQSKYLDRLYVDLDYYGELVFLCEYCKNKYTKK